MKWVVLSNAGETVSGRKERISTASAEHTEGTEKKRASTGVTPSAVLV